MTPPLLLDSCALIWVLNGDDIKPAARAQIEQELEERRQIYASPISAWELGLLQSRNKLITAGPLMEKLSELSALAWADMSPEVLYASSFLPATPPNDPGDRIIITTARELDMTIVTRDRQILDYGQSGHVRCLPC
ncbi:MAG: type II toxin-antitoxin system VapC family toxin [Parvibaculales bacterium]